MSLCVLSPERLLASVELVDVSDCPAVISASEDGNDVRVYTTFSNLSAVSEVDCDWLDLSEDSHGLEVRVTQLTMLA